MPTPTERRIIQTRNARGVLVPLLEELHERPVEVEDEEDFAFIDMLMRARANPREKGVFSPSMIGSCIRQAYLSKRGEEKYLAASPQTYGYFNKGNFVHFQWQFALWKAERAGLLKLYRIPNMIPGVHPMFAKERPAVEVRIRLDDEGGTIDAIPVIDDNLYITDFKGLRLDDYMKQVRKGAKAEYRKQIIGYAMVWNSLFGDYIPIHNCLLVAECKAGPVSGTGSPLGLHEAMVSVGEFRGEVAKRMRTLHWYDDRSEMPPPECVSTRHMRYQECPFNRFCREEVRAIQREREAKAKESPRDWKPARPGR